MLGLDKLEDKLDQDLKDRIGQLDESGKNLLQIVLSTTQTWIQQETGQIRAELQAWRDWADSRRVQVTVTANAELVPKTVGPEPPTSAQ